MLIFGILDLIVFCILLFLLWGMWRTRATLHSPRFLEFSQGSLSKPEGEYRGWAEGYRGKSWQGKTFYPLKLAGTNNFKNKQGVAYQNFPFKTYMSAGVRNQNMQTFKIDYNIPKNPFWVRPVLDEIVEIAPNKHLGQIHYRIFPGVIFTISYSLWKNERFP